MPESKAGTKPSKRSKRPVASKDTKETTIEEAGGEKTPSTTTIDPFAALAASLAAPASNQKPTTTSKTTKRPAKAASQATIPPLPEDPLQASLVMGCHKVYARQLQKRLDEFEVKFKAVLEAEGPTPAMSEAWKEALEAHEEVQETVKDWIERWTSGK